jgi:hypothetical protein
MDGSGVVIEGLHRGIGVLAMFAERFTLHPPHSPGGSYRCPFCSDLLLVTRALIGSVRAASRSGDKADARATRVTGRVINEG